MKAAILLTWSTTKQTHQNPGSYKGHDLDSQDISFSIPESVLTAYHRSMNNISTGSILIDLNKPRHQHPITWSTPRFSLLPCPSWVFLLRMPNGGGRSIWLCARSSITRTAPFWRMLGDVAVSFFLTYRLFFRLSFQTKYKYLSVTRWCNSKRPGVPERQSALHYLLGWRPVHLLCVSQYFSPRSPSHHCNTSISKITWHPAMSVRYLIWANMVTYSWMQWRQVFREELYRCRWDARTQEEIFWQDQLFRLRISLVTPIRMRVKEGKIRRYELK